MRDITLKWTLFLASALTVALVSSPAAAQDGEDEPPAEESALPDEIVEAAEEGDESAGEGEAEGEGESAEETAEGEETAESAEEGAEPADAGDEPVEEVDAITLEPGDPLYWADMRGVYTVQKRQFQKNGRFGVTLYGGLIPNNIFEHYYPVGLRLNYFILENLGIELAGSYAFKADTGVVGLISEPSGVEAQQILIGDTQRAHTNFGVVWSPFYGKTSFYADALNYFDAYLFAGVGLVITETIPQFNAEPEADYKPEGALGAGLAYYFGRHSLLRIDFRQFVFQKVVGGVANPSEVSLGVGYFF